MQYWLKRFVLNRLSMNSVAYANFGQIGAVLLQYGNMHG